MTLTESNAEPSRPNLAAIPVIDLTDLIDGGETDAVAHAIHAAATEVGFFYLSGHGIAPARIDTAFAACRDFFALPTEQKASAAVGTDQRGWMASGMAHMEGAATHDLKEVFFWGTEIAPDDPDLLAGVPLVARNRWPDDTFPALRRALTPYHADVCRVASAVLSAVAVGFDQTPDFFTTRYAKPLARGQLVHYPPSGETDEREQRFGVAPHTDFGVLTFLLQDDSGGLQVRTRAGEWIEAPPVPGTLVCNIGDLLQRWSNDRFVSTVHRVVNRSGHARHSIPVFFDPNARTVVDPCDLGVSRADARHAPVTAGAYIAGRNGRNFTQYAAFEREER